MMLRRVSKTEDPGTALQHVVPRIISPSACWIPHVAPECCDFASLLILSELIIDVGDGDGK